MVSLALLPGNPAVQTRVVAGGFASLAWLAELDVQFAELYFSALRHNAGRAAVARLLARSIRPEGPVLVARIQFALAGINAHINHDLPSPSSTRAWPPGPSTARLAGISGLHRHQHNLGRPDRQS